MAERRAKRQPSVPDDLVDAVNDPEEEAEPDTEFTVNGKHTAPGHVVRYTTRLGSVHHATVARLEQQGDGTTRADLDAEVDGRWQRFAGVPHSAAGGINTWDHAPSED